MNAAELASVQAKVCGTKIHYSRKSAADVSSQMRARGERVSPYACPFCDAWHIGHVPSMETVARIAAAIRYQATGTDLALPDRVMATAGVHPVPQRTARPHRPDPTYPPSPKQETCP